MDSTKLLFFRALSFILCSFTFYKPRGSRPPASGSLVEAVVRPHRSLVLRYWCWYIIGYLLVNKLKSVRTDLERAADFVRPPSLSGRSGTEGSSRLSSSSSSSSSSLLSGEDSNYCEGTSDYMWSTYPEDPAASAKLWEHNRSTGRSAREFGAGAGGVGGKRNERTKEIGGVGGAEGRQVRLTNKMPVWNPEINSLVLKFERGRVLKAR